MNMIQRQRNAVVFPVLYANKHQLNVLIMQNVVMVLVNVLINLLQITNIDVVYNFYSKSFVLMFYYSGSMSKSGLKSGKNSISR